MASAVIDDEPSVNDCSICHELFTEPKLLTCGHHLCRSCLLSWLQTRDEALCPFCRNQILGPEERKSGKRLEDIVDEFPTDFALETLVEAYRLLSTRQMCCICDDVPAESMCLNCRDMFCQSCSTMHRKQSATRHHTLENLSTLTAERLTAFNLSSCSYHTGKPCELFCVSHNVPICQLCASSRHRRCPEVKDLAEKMEESRAELVELEDSLRAAETKLEQAIGQLEQQFQDSMKETQTALAEVDVTCDRLEAAVKVCRLRLKDMIQGASSENEKTWRESTNILLSSQEQLSSHKRLIERARDQTTPKQMDNMITVLKTQMKNIDFSATVPVHTPTFTRPVVLIDPKIVINLETTLSTLGQIQALTASSNAFRFQDNDRENIELSNKQRTAAICCIDDAGHGIVMSKEPMMVDTLYEVRVDQIELPERSSLAVGAVTSVLKGTTLPVRSSELKNAVIVYSSGVRDFGVWTNKQVGETLAHLTEFNRLGVKLDNNRNLHLYFNSFDQGVVSTRELSAPCFAVFEMSPFPGTTVQITALPSSSK